MKDKKCECDWPEAPHVHDGVVCCSRCNGFVACDYCDEAATDIASNTYRIVSCSAHTDEAQEALYRI